MAFLEGLLISTIDFMAPATNGVVIDNFTLFYFGFTSTGLQESTKKRAKIEEKNDKKTRQEIS